MDAPRNQIAQFLARIEFRLALSVAIVVSLLPLPWVGDLDLVFLTVFAIEFVLRCVASFKGGSFQSRAGGRVERRWIVWLLLCLDLLALISFLPINLGPGAAGRWFRIFRLSRMLLLLGYWAPLVGDLWGVALRGERGRQLALMSFIVLTSALAGAIVLEHGLGEEGMDFNDDGRATSVDRRFIVRLWWAFRQIQDPGNMLTTPDIVLGVLVSLALTVLGLFLVSFLIGLGGDIVRELLLIGRRRPPGLRDHTVVVNVGPATEPLLLELAGYYRKLLPEGRLSRRWLRQFLLNARRGFVGHRFVLAGTHPEVPDFLDRPELASVIYRHFDAGGDEFIPRTDLLAAHRVVLLADLSEDDADARTTRAIFDIVESHAGFVLQQGGGWPNLRSQSAERGAKLVAEVMAGHNLAPAGAALNGGVHHPESCTVPAEHMIALYIACVARRPGVERVLEELLTSRGSELYTWTEDAEDAQGEMGVELKARAPLRDQLARLFHLAESSRRGAELVPVGLILSRGPTTGEESPDYESVRLAINPTPSELADPTWHCRGFIAIAPNYGVVCDFADAVGPSLKSGDGQTIEEPAQARSWQRSPTAELSRVLVLGFRPSTARLLQAMAAAHPGLRLTVVVASEAERARAVAICLATRLDDPVARHAGLEEGQERLRFAQVDSHSLSLGDRRVDFHVGDFDEPGSLENLPGGLGSVDSLDLILTIADEDLSSDAETTLFLMRLDAERLRGKTERWPRVVAEIIDVELAQRLQERYRRQPSSAVTIVSQQELRAHFIFQSVVVPHFELVYSELLGPWGQSLLRLVPKHPTSLAELPQLVGAFFARGKIVVAVETIDHDGNTRLLACVGRDLDRPEGAAEQIQSAWVISEDRQRASAL